MATWQENLKYYGTDAGKSAALAEIARAQDVWKQKTAGGDTAGAQAAHHWANQIREAMGLKSGIDYNPIDGAALGGQLNPSQTTGGSSYASQLVELVNQPLPSAPSIPSFNYSYPNVPSISYEEAMQRASGVLGPQMEASKSRLMQTYMKQRKLLPKYLNARGQLYSGLRTGGEAALSQEEAMALEQLSLDIAAKQAEMAQSIQERDENRARALAEQMWQAQQADADKQLALYQAAMQNYAAEKDSRANLLLRLMQQEEDKETAARAAQQWEKEFGLQQQQWGSDPRSQDWYLPTYRQQLEAELAATNRSNRPTASTSGGSKSSEASLEDAFQDDLSGYISEVYSGNRTLGDALTEIDVYVRGGIMPADYGEQLKARLRSAFGNRALAR